MCAPRTLCLRQMISQKSTASMYRPIDAEPTGSSKARAFPR
jgi:hypothetical protein